MTRLKPPMLEFTDATVVLGMTPVLNNVTLSIAEDENVAIIGPNGSGKSTLVKTITREHYAVSDTVEYPVRIFGETVWDVFSLRNMLGIVSDDLQNINRRSFTGREVVLSGFYSSVGLFPYHSITPEMENAAREAVEFINIPHLWEKKANRLSTGELRRLMIARALVHDPKALILDEPTNSLDIRAAARFRGAMRRVAQSGRSIILVTHHLEDIIPEIDRVITISSGKILRDGPKDEILEEKHLSDLFEMPVKVREHDGYYYAWGIQS